MDAFELRAGSCLDPGNGLASLRPRSVDVVITDPPYSEHVHGNSMRCRRRGAAGRQGEPAPGTLAEPRALGFAALTEANMHATAAELARVARRWVLIFCDVESVAAWRGAVVGVGLEYIRAGAWVKRGAAPQFSGDRPAAGFEAIVIAHPKGRKTWNGGGRPAVWECPIVGSSDSAAERRYHTTQKPIALMERLVADFSERGELVCDPFAGSGSTGVAALRNGRRFLGWELAPRDHSIARRRLNGAKEQLHLFEKAPRLRRRARELLAAS